ncbi:hypothetical protein [Calothrix sp. NIES-2100]
MRQKTRSDRPASFLFQAIAVSGVIEYQAITGFAPIEDGLNRPGSTVPK